MGGSVTLVAAADHELGAAVTFYGGGVSQGRFGFDPLVEVAPRLQTPWLGLFGDLDQGIPIDDVEALRAAAATAPVSTEVVRYAEAGHGFNCDQRVLVPPALGHRRLGPHAGLVRPAPALSGQPSVRPTSGPVQRGQVWLRG